MPTHFQTFQQFQLFFVFKKEVINSIYTLESSGQGINHHIVSFNTKPLNQQVTKIVNIVKIVKNCQN